MKAISLALFLVVFSARLLPAQELPDLKSSDLLARDSMKKKSGWLKVGLDSNFQATWDSATTRYVYYEFVNKKGQYNSTYSKRTPFPNAPKIEYSGGKSDSVVLLDGVVSAYDEVGNPFMQYLFNKGFYVKACDYAESGKLATLIEYIPKLTSVELYANYFDDAGNIKSDSHEENDGMTYRKLEGRRDITPIVQ